MYCTNEKKLEITNKVDLRLKMAKQQQSFFKNMIKVVFRTKFEEENSDDEDNKLIIKHNPINSNQSLNSINYLASEHTKCLQ